MSTILSELRSYPRSLFYVLVLGVSLRFVFIALYQRPLMSDEREYDSLATALASTGSYSYEGVPTAYRPVGYPAIVGSLYYIAAHRPIIVKYFQAVLDTGTAFLLFLLLAGRSNRVRVLGTVLWVVYIPAILYSNLLMSETATAFLLTLAAYLICRRSGDRKGTFAAIGICFGILVLIKPGVIILPLFLIFLLSRIDISWRRVHLAVIAFLLVVAPWIVRNYILFDQVALSSNGGINLLIGNNPRATGAYGITYDPEILQGTKEEFNADRQAFRWASSYIMGHPGVFAVNAVKKAGRLFESEGGLLVLSFHSNPEDTTTHYSTKYASIPLPLTVVANLPYFLLLILGVAGFLASRKDPLWWFTLSLMGSLALVHIIYFGGGRFHFPLMPFAVIFAAQCLGGGSNLVKSLPRVQKIIGTIIVLLLASLWVYEGVLIFSA